MWRYVKAAIRDNTWVEEGTGDGRSRHLGGGAWDARTRGLTIATNM